MSKKDKEKKKILKAARKAAEAEAAEKASKTETPTKNDYVDNSMTGFIERVHTNGKIVLHVGHWGLLDKLRHYIGGDSVEGLYKRRRLRDDLTKGKGKDGVIDLDDLLHDATHVLIAQLSDNGHLQQAATYLAKKWHEKFPGARRSSPPARRASWTSRCCFRSGAPSWSATRPTPTGTSGPRSWGSATTTGWVGSSSR